MEVQRYFAELIEDVGVSEDQIMGKTCNMRLLEEGACPAVDAEKLRTLSRIYEILWNLYYTGENKLKEKESPSFFQPTIVPLGSEGRPIYDITYDQVVFLRNLGMSWSGMSKAFGISTRTIYRRKSQWNYETIKPYMSNDVLMELIQEILSHTPNADEVDVFGSLRAKKVCVSRWRIQECLQVLDSLGRALPQHCKIQRRKYQVKGANYLWHIDSNYNLMPYRLVLHGCIDGHSRTIIYLKCVTNNKTGSVLKLFQDGISEFGIPSRVRGDRGVENTDVAQFILDQQGVDRGSFIVGHSVHNQRIERLWTEVNRVVTKPFKDLFLFMKQWNCLDEHNEIDIRCLHMVYIPRIAKRLNEFIAQWNHNGLCSVRSKSPVQQWTAARLKGTFYEKTVTLEDDSYLDNPDMYGVDELGPPPEIETDHNVILPALELNLSTEQIQRINVAVANPLSDDDLCGMDHYLKIRQILLDD